MAMRSRVAVLRVTPETVLDDVGRVMELAGLRQALDPRSPVILKDNITWHFPFPAANTTPWQLEGVVRALRAAGYGDVTCVQNDTVVTNAFKGEDLNHYLPILKSYGVPVLYNFKNTDMKWVEYRPKARMLVLDHIFPEGIRVPDYFLGRGILHLPTVKTHIHTTTTGAMKNAFGGLLSTKRHYTHTWIHDTLVDLLAIQREIHTGLFAVMDGTTAGNGAGPRTMIPVVKDVVLASADQVAIDAVAARLMGFDPLAIAYIARAHALGLGVGDPREIEVVGDDVSGESWGFQVGGNLIKVAARIFWFGPLKGIQGFFFRTPLVHAFILASEIYHDYFRWGLIDRHAFDAWRRSTHWGHLFERYAREGTLVRADGGR
jgi:uncharacterized protein (DUF362 family)